MAALRNGLRRVANDRKEWAGIPMPMEGMRLVIEPTYPKAAELAAIGKPAEDEPDNDGAKLRNTFWSDRLRMNICIWEEADGRILGGPAGKSNNQVGLLLATLEAADAWGIEQERNAIDTLGSMLRHRIFKQYLLTGMFLETSKRSSVHYLFRRLRPTIAFSTRTGTARILCALCLHPIGYYEGSWAGAMCPTDDVIAMLALMRGDEHMLWKRANQHHPSRREAGI